MIELRLDDPHFAENALAAMSLKKMGFRAKQSIENIKAIVRIVGAKSLTRICR